MENLRYSAFGKVVLEYCYEECIEKHDYVACNPYKCQTLNIKVEKEIVEVLKSRGISNFGKIQVKAWSEDIMEEHVENGEDYVIIYLDIGLQVKMDKEDFERTKHLKWHLKRSHGNRLYVAHSEHLNKTIYMHRFIMECEKGKEVHHINGDGLDNRKSNLEKVTSSENKKSGKYKR